MTKKDIILTGDRPTGPLHLGHYVGSLANRVKLQDSCHQFIIIADTQALTDNFDNPDKVRTNVFQVILDYLAVGIDPQKTTIFIQSMIPALCELTMYYMNLVPFNRVLRNPTVKTEIKDKNMEESVPFGFVAYPISQAADITAFKATIVPVGEDQLPMIEQTNEIVRAFNRIYQTDVLVEAKAVMGAGKRLPGTDGREKMGKSLGNAIYLGDPADVVTKKVMNMYTDPNHLRVQDPGKIEGNTVFAYLDIFDPNKDEVQALKEHYERGGLGDVVVKRRLNEILQAFLEPIRTKREAFAKDRAAIDQILIDGTQRANEVAQETLDQVKRAMKLDYFA